MSLRSLFIPTPDVQNYPNYYLVQLLAKERVRCLLSGESFVNISEYLVEKYLEAPSHLVSVKDIKDFILEKGKEVLESFKTFEKDSSYKAALETLIPYKGYKFDFLGVTISGIMLMVEVDEPQP